MNKTISLLLLIISVSLYSQQDIPVSFKNLTELKLDGFNVFFQSETSSIIRKNRNKLPKDHVLYIDDNLDKDDIVAIKVKLNSKTDSIFYLVCSYGPSYDPEFQFYSITEGKLVGSVPGTKIFIPGNSNLYLSGHNNSEFNMRRKYKFEGGKFIWVKQPFYYVGLETKTINPIKIYLNQNLTQEIAALPANYDIEILIADYSTIPYEVRYLVKTPFGLVGWTKILAGQYKSIDVEGIFYNGD